MEIPPNCAIKIPMNKKVLTFETNPLVAQRRKDQPIVINNDKSNKNSGKPHKEILITILEYPSKDKIDVFYAFGVLLTAKLP